MKNKSLGEKFKVNIVKPLYRKVKLNRVSPKTPKTFIIDASKLDGHDVVKRAVNNENVDVFKTINNLLPNAIESVSNDKVNKVVNSKIVIKRRNIRTVIKCVKKDRLRESNMRFDKGKTDTENLNTTNNKAVQVNSQPVVIPKVTDTWLRVYPAPAYPGEPTCSIVLRCVVCQLGLFTILTFWTVFWIFIIHFFEEPYETMICAQFERNQNRLVIDLATELRQITPLSPKWREAIEARIAQERQLTTDAISKGARLHPGHFWDLPGTLLFTIYVMTALGFGAPVPQTFGGRTSSIVYACLAVPLHIYIMVNASTCMVVHVEAWLKKNIEDKVPFMFGKNSFNTQGDSPACSRNSDLMKNNRKRNLQIKLMRICSVLCTGRCVPLAAVLYYILGAIIFGLLQSKPILETVMFPIQFTTGGGLEHVDGYMRILYAFYVEGAMSMLACALATLRRHSSATVTTMSEKYRLFAVEKHRDT